MKWSSRVPDSFAPNAWSAALAERRRLGLEILDLTESNPTAVGLSGEGRWLEALAAPAARRYEPEPRGLASARAAVCRYYAERGTAAAPEDVVLTSGTSESYAHLFRVLCDPGDVVLVPNPGYPLFEPLAAAEGVEVAPYRLVRRGGRFVLDRESLPASTQQVRGMVVVQPNPPVGSMLDANDLAFLEDWCVRQDVALISDEVFLDFPLESPGASLPTLLGDRRCTTFVLNGLSKLCGLPQLKLGWIVAAGPDRERAVEKLEWISDLFLTVGAPVQHALPEILGERHAFRERVLERVKVNLQILHAAGDVWRGDGGWSAVLELPGHDDDEAWALRLLERGVLVQPGHFYDLEQRSCVVVSLITPSEVLKKAVGRLKELLTRS